MSVIMYLDTQKITKKLVASGLTESQAESITDVARDITANNLEHLATKDDVQKSHIALKGEIDNVRTELKGEIKTVNQKIETVNQKIETVKSQLETKIEESSNKTVKNLGVLIALGIVVIKVLSYFGI